MRAKPSAAEVRVVVEVDGNPVGFLNLDMERLWPLINHNFKEKPTAEWIDRQRFETILHAVVARNLSNRLQRHLYGALGNEIVKAELDIEGFMLRAESVVQAFGSKRKEIEKLAAKTGNVPEDFLDFFWQHMMDDSEGVDLKKAWKKAAAQR